MANHVRQLKRRIILRSSGSYEILTAELTNILICFLSVSWAGLAMSPINASQGWIQRVIIWMKRIAWGVSPLLALIVLQRVHGVADALLSGIATTLCVLWLFVSIVVFDPSYRAKLDIMSKLPLGKS